MGEGIDIARERLIGRYCSALLERMEGYLPGLTQEVRDRLFGRTEYWKAVALLNGLAAESSAAEWSKAQAATNGATLGPTGRIEETPKNPTSPPTRTPDIETSRKRITLHKTLARELATLKERLKRFCDAPMLKREYPNFELWHHIQKSELDELLDGEKFTPKAFAGSIAVRVFGGTSLETLKKDRRKLKTAKSEQIG